MASHVTLSLPSVLRLIGIAALGIATFTPSASAQEYYRVDFESARHVVGTTPATGGSDAPTNTSGTPRVTFTGGSKKLRFDATGYSDFTYATAEFQLGRGASYYRIEFDVTPVAMPEWRGGNPSFRLLLDTPIVENLEFFRSNGVTTAMIRTFNGGVLGASTLPSLPTTPTLRCVVGVNLRTRRWTISFNGQRLHEGPFYSESGDIQNMRFGAANVGPGSTIVDFDNLVVTAVTPPFVSGLQLATQTVLDGESALFNLALPPQGTGPFRYQWRRNGVDIPGATSSILMLVNVAPAQTGNYTVVVSNDAGSAESGIGALIVRPRAPTLSAAAQPTSRSALVGDTVTLALREPPGGTPPFTYQWFRNGASLPAATGDSYIIANVSAGHAGAYHVVVTNDAGSVVSSTATLTVGARSPVIAAGAQPLPLAIDVGGTIALALQSAPEGTAPFTYQWKRDGVAIVGATNATLNIATAGLSQAGQYSVVVSNSGGATESRAVAVTVRERTRAVNLSVRAASGAGEDALIIGFALRSNTGRQVIVRAVGPALRSFGVTSALENPRLIVATSSGVMVAQNENWSDAGATATNEHFAAVGAFPLAAGSGDAATRLALTPGSYTAQILGATTTPGDALGELYDLESADGGLGRLVNVSARASVDANNQSLIVGVVIAGPGRQRFLFRAVGPTLQQFGVAGAALNPRLSVRHANGSEVAENDDWGSASAVVLASSQVGAFALGNNSRDSAAIVELAAGSYTVVISPAAGSAGGIVLAEAYELP